MTKNNSNLVPAHFRQHVCVRVPCSLWSVESCQRVCSLISILIEMYMYVHVYVYGCLNISVPVSVHAYACVSGYLVACAYRRVTLTQSSAARPPARSASRSSVFSGWHVLGCAGSTEPVACAACQSGIQDTGAAHNAVEALIHAAAGVCFVRVVCCSVGVRVVNVGMYVCGPACCVLWCAAASATIPTHS